MRKLYLVMLAALTASFSAFAGNVISKTDVKRAEDLVSRMTLEEKVGLIAGQIDGFHTFGVDRLGIPVVRMADGPQGVRNNTHSTYYPCGISLAASFSAAAVHGVGEGIGFDARARGVGIMLCPGVNIYRSALCGRNFEYFGEDPYLAAQTALQYINGIQQSSVVATIKHFAVNNSEYDRHQTSSQVDERTLNEIYFPAFRNAIEKADVGAVMTSYNPVNGVHAAESQFLTKDCLRAWGHKGIIMSDWKSTYTTLGCLESGLDLEMPKAFELTIDKIRPLLDNGIVSEKLIDEKCTNILATFSAFGFLDKPMKDESIPEDYEVSRGLAYNAALEGVVMLKNALPSNGSPVLPLAKKQKKIVVCGPNADYVAFGGGSGKMDPFPERNISFYKAISGVKGLNVVLSDDVEEMKKADVVIVAAGFSSKTEKENSDRTYTLPEGQNELIIKAAAACPRTVVIINSGGEVDVNPWFDKVGSVLMAWYGGQEGGKALTDIITGKVSPSGRLPFTFWGTLEANPASQYYHKSTPAIIAVSTIRDPYPHSHYAEGIFVGYRGEQKFGVKPMFPFGFGLTYSQFSYSDLVVAESGDGFDVSFKLTNTGKKEAAEVAQVYVAPVNPSVLRPNHELKGFEKVRLAGGASKTVTLHLGPDAFSFYDVSIHDWKLDRCSYKIQVASDADSILLEKEISL